MDQIQLKAVIRDQKGKQAVKRLRTGGQVPAVVYRRGEEPVAVTLSAKEIGRVLQTAGGENALISLTIESQKKSRPRAVIIKETQHHPVKRSLLHVDFHEISLTEKITVEVEVVAVGESVGVKQEGGLLDHPLRQLKIQCLPTDIPKNIEVDVSGLKLNDTLHVKDLKLSEKLKVLNDPESLLFQVKLPMEEKVEEAPVEGAAAEPEVIREKKEEEPPAGGAKPGEKAEKAKEEPKAKDAAKTEKK